MRTCALLILSGRVAFGLLLAAASCVCGKEAMGQEFRVVTYLPDYACNRLKNLDGHGETWLEKLRLEGVDCVILIGAVRVTQDGTLHPVWLDEPVEGKWRLTRDDFLAIRKYLEQKKIDLGLAVTADGWMKGGTLAHVAKDPVLRRVLARSIAGFCRQEGIKSVDFDWEFPQGDAEEAGYEMLIRETRAAVAGLRIPVSICICGYDRDDLTAGTIEAADYVHLMSYLPETEEKARFLLEETRRHIRYLIDDRNCPPGKLLMGIGFFGRQADRPTDERPRHRPYWWLYRNHRPLRSADRADGYWFNGVDTTIAKVELAWQQRLAGVMVWECSQDVHADEPDGVSLQNAISRTVDRMASQGPQHAE